MYNNKMSQTAELLDDLYARAEQLRNQIRGFHLTTFWRDLRRFESNILAIAVEISKEEVRCRRLNKETAHLLTLVDNFEQSIVNCEQYLTIALLSKQE